MACVLRWDAQDVATWLDQCLQLPNAEVEAFKEADIDGPRLVDLKEEDLTALNVHDSAHRLRLLSHVTVFRAQLGRPLIVDESSLVFLAESSRSVISSARGELIEQPPAELVAEACSGFFGSPRQESCEQPPVEIIETHYSGVFGLADSCEQASIEGIGSVSGGLLASARGEPIAHDVGEFVEVSNDMLAAASSEPIAQMQPQHNASKGIHPAINANRRTASARRLRSSCGCSGPSQTVQTPRLPRQPQRSWSTGIVQRRAESRSVTALLSTPVATSHHGKANNVFPGAWRHASASSRAPTQKHDARGVASHFAAGAAPTDPAVLKLPSAPVSVKLAFDSPYSAGTGHCQEDSAPQTPIPHGLRLAPEERVGGITMSAATPSTADSSDAHVIPLPKKLSTHHVQSGGSSSSHAATRSGSNTNFENSRGRAPDMKRSASAPRCSSADASASTSTRHAQRSKSPSGKAIPRIASQITDSAKGEPQFKPTARTFAEHVNSEFGVDRRSCGAPFACSASRKLELEVLARASSPGPASYSPNGETVLKTFGNTKFARDTRRTMDSLRMPCHESAGTGRFLPSQKETVIGGRFGTAARMPTTARDKSPGPTAYTPRHHYRSDFN